MIGQDEAVAAVVERIAMLKAGLNDPGKPIGVFLFAGPTGTGKTELAKTLAEFLFGSAERMIRLDMSEFQTPESTAKILGSGEAAQPTRSSTACASSRSRWCCSTSSRRRMPASGTCSCRCSTTAG